jgi:uncharacterized protein with GYD domain
VAKFVSLVSWTEQGVANFQDTIDRAEQARQLAQELGGTIETVYWTLGPYDVVVTADFPDEQAASAFFLAVGSRGNTRSVTMRAFDADEMRSIIDKAG